jgi:hypothetical protein
MGHARFLHRCTCDHRLPLLTRDAQRDLSYFRSVAVTTPRSIAGHRSPSRQSFAWVRVFPRNCRRPLLLARRAKQVLDAAPLRVRQVARIAARAPRVPGTMLVGPHGNPSPVVSHGPLSSSVLAKDSMVKQALILVARSPTGRVEKVTCTWPHSTGGTSELPGVLHVRLFRIPWFAPEDARRMPSAAHISTS